MLPESNILPSLYMNQMYKLIVCCLSIQMKSAQDTEIPPTQKEHHTHKLKDLLHE
jgi:hypothetical protein